MKRRIHIRPGTASDAKSVTVECAAGPGARCSANALRRLAESGCLLVATTGEHLLGAVGLDLGKHAIAGPWLRTSANAKNTANRLLDAGERLAVQYGLTRLDVKVGDDGVSFFAGKGYRPARDDKREATLSRSILRRSTRFSRRVRTINEELGIPADYGARHQLRLQPEAKTLRSIGRDVFDRPQKLLPPAAKAWKDMARAADANGVEIQAVSAFRTVDYQAGLIRRKLEKGQSIDRILSVSAAPGFSEHHSGCAIDVTTPGCEILEEPFENTEAFAWLQQNAGRYGFTLSYPRGNPHGVLYEPWHWMWRKP